MKEVYFYEFKATIDINIVPPYRFFTDLEKAEEQWKLDNEKKASYEYLSPIQHGWLPEGAKFPVGWSTKE